MLESVSDYALVNKPKESYVCGNVLVKNSPDTQFGDRYYLNGPVTLICPTGEEGEAPFTPEILDGDLTKSNGFDKKTDNNDEVGIVNQQKFKIRKLHLLAGAFSLVVIATVATLAVVLTSTTHPEHDEDNDNGSLKIISRGEWFALERTGSVDPMQILPAPYIILSDSTPIRCPTVESCSNVMRLLQKDHTENRHFSDIAFNFVMGYEGSVFEGRGWDIAGAHTGKLNSRSIGISFIGFFGEIIPSEKTLSSFWKLVQLGVEENKISVNFTIFTHRDIRGSESPGKSFYNLIKTWPQWRKYDPQKDVPPYNFFI